MTAQRRQIVLDKSAFVALMGRQFDTLRRFAERHFLILPSVLHDECVTNEGKAVQLLDKYEQLILAGGFFCPSVRCIAEMEAQSLQPYGLLPDFDGTESWRVALRNGLTLAVPTDVDLIDKEHLRIAKSHLDLNPMVVDTLFGKQFRQAETEIRHTNASRQDRLRRWVQIIDGCPLAGWTAGILEHFRSSVVDDRLVSDRWVTWHHLRVISVMGLDLRFLEESRPANKVEHDLQDMEYVSLLSRADAIITQDNGLIELARAAFPEKDVFSSLEEVPESYRCDWTES